MISFRVWIRQFNDVDRAIGDLARDVQNDSKFPTKNDYGIILEYLQSMNAIDNAIETFRTSWGDYLCHGMSAKDFLRFKDTKASGFNDMD